MKDFDWELLHELYKNPNLTKVANVLYITQPTLTKRLQHIEAEFDVTIVERTPKGLEFTPEGKYLAEQAEVYLRFLKQTRSHLEQMRENGGEIVTVGSSYTYGKYTLPDQLIRFRMECPNVRFQVQNAHSNQLFRQLLDGTVDVAFVRGDYEGAINRVLLGRTNAYAMTKQPLEDLSQLLEQRRLWYSTNAESKKLLDEWWEEQFQQVPPTGQVMGYVDVVWQMVQKGLGYTLCFLPEEYTNPYGLCLTPLVRKDGTPVTRNTWFLYPRNKRLNENVEHFVDFILRQRRTIASATGSGSFSPAVCQNTSEASTR